MYRQTSMILDDQPQKSGLNHSRIVSAQTQKPPRMVSFVSGHSSRSEGREAGWRNSKFSQNFSTDGRWRPYFAVHKPKLKACDLVICRKGCGIYLVIGRLRFVPFPHCNYLGVDRLDS
ncbi:hypothetical protein OPQ81_010031 [Rhizoctonia solani]|nr:hypothetical protein OPQ81_010031 [Rhizoctonia solani]